MYHISAYYVAKAVVEIPFTLISPLLFGSILYYMTFLDPAPERFAVFMGLLLMEALCGTALGIMVSALAPTAKVAGAIAPPFATCFILWSGFIINIKSLPKAISWGPYISLVRVS